MTIGNTFSITIKNSMGDEYQYVFNLKHCMYICRTSPTCIRFVFGTHNLVMHFNSMEAARNYLEQFTKLLDNQLTAVEIAQEDYDTAEIEIKE